MKPCLRFLENKSLLVRILTSSLLIFLGAASDPTPAFHLSHWSALAETISTLLIVFSHHNCTDDEEAIGSG